MEEQYEVTAVPVFDYCMFDAPYRGSYYYLGDWWWCEECEDYHEKGEYHEKDQD